MKSITLSLDGVCNLVIVDEELVYGVFALSLWTKNRCMMSIILSLWKKNRSWYLQPCHCGRRTGHGIYNLVIVEEEQVCDVFYLVIIEEEQVYRVCNLVIVEEEQVMVSITLSSCVILLGDIVLYETLTDHAYEVAGYQHQNTADVKF